MKTEKEAKKAKALIAYCYENAINGKEPIDIAMELLCQAHSPAYRAKHFNPYGAIRIYGVENICNLVATAFETELTEFSFNVGNITVPFVEESA